MWEANLVLLLRVLLNDFDETKYTDARLKQLIVAAATQVTMEIEFDRTYIIDMGALTISPDPYQVSAQGDLDFINFVALKSLCILDQAELRVKALISGLQAKIGPASLSTLRSLPGFSELLDKGPCASYVTLKENYAYSNFLIRAIFSPFVSNDYNPPVGSSDYTRSNRV